MEGESRLTATSTYLFCLELEKAISWHKNVIHFPATKATKTFGSKARLVQGKVSHHQSRLTGFGMFCDVTGFPR